MSTEEIDQEPPATGQATEEQQQPTPPAPPTQEPPKSDIEQLFAPWKATLEKGGQQAPRIREILKGLHDSDGALLNSDEYPKLKRYIVDNIKPSCSPALVDKSRKEVLALVEKEGSDEPQFPDQPAGGQKKQPTTQEPPSGAPFSGGPPIQPQATGDAGALPADGEAPADEPMVWDKKKVGKIMKMMLNMPGWGLEEWIRINEHEEKELGDSFLTIFQEYLPTTKKTGNFLYALAAIEAIIKPRATAAIQYRLMHKKLEEVKAKALAEIKEAMEDGE